MKEKKFVHLRESSLARVWDWCEENEDNPIAEAYMNACVLVGEIDPSKILKGLKSSYNTPVKDKLFSRLVTVSYDIKTLAFVQRDTIGRVILAIMKREAKLKELES